VPFSSSIMNNVMMMIMLVKMNMTSTDKSKIPNNIKLPMNIASTTMTTMDTVAKVLLMINQIEIIDKK